MKYMLLLWLSQDPGLVSKKWGDFEVASAALGWTLDPWQPLSAYERSLLERTARHELTLTHLLAYLREDDQA